jgi:hypothetical protein
MKTYLLEKEKEQCQEEIEEKKKTIYREREKFVGKEEFKEKLEKFDANDCTLSDISPKYILLSENCEDSSNSDSSFNLESSYDSDVDRVD